MATSYKIRLRRFNGVDYDTLNLSSDNIIMGNGNTLQSIIPSSNGIVKINNGVFQTATDGTDYLTRATNYSPVFRLSPGDSHVITSADSGKTFVDSYSSTALTLDILLTLSQADSSAFPVGAEIALTRIYSKSTKLTVSGVRLFNADAGIIGSASGTATVQISPQRGMAAIKKIESNTTTYGDVWLLTGNVEVVT